MERLDEIAKDANMLQPSTGVSEVELLGTETDAQVAKERLAILSNKTFEEAQVEREALKQACILWNKEQGEDAVAPSKLFNDELDNWSSVIELVSAEQRKWNDRKRPLGGKPQQLFHRFCSILDAHKVMLDVFPQSNQYASIFCGALRTLIKASVNYTKIAEGLSQALVEITEQVNLARRQVAAIYTDGTICAFARLYKEIFVFLKACVGWFTSSSKLKILISFRENFYDNFRDKLTEIKSIASRISEEGAMGNWTNTLVILGHVEELRRRKEAKAREREIRENSGKTLDEKMDLIIELLYQQAQAGNQTIGLPSADPEKDQRGHEQGHLYHQGQLPSNVLPPVMPAPTGESNLDSTNIYAKEAVQPDCRSLQEYIVGDSGLIMSLLPPLAFVADDIAIRLQEWLHTRASRTLWIQGSRETRYPSAASTIASGLIEAGVRANTQIVFHFCELPEGETACSVEVIGVISLLYSLIRQLVRYFDGEVHTDVDLSEARFRLLDGSEESFGVGLKLFQDLLNLAPRFLFVIVDGVDRVDYGEGRAMLEKLLEALKQRVVDCSGTGYVLKPNPLIRLAADRTHHLQNQNTAILRMDWENICFNAGAFVAGLFILESGADRFVDHTAIVARRLKVSPTLIALLTAGAEWEELAVVIAAISQRRSSLALGNILGSSVSNILGAFSLGLIFHPGIVVFDRSSKIYSAVVLIFTTLLVGVLALGALGRVIGGILVTLFVGYVASVSYGIYKDILAVPEDSDSDSDSDSDDESGSESDDDGEGYDEEKLNKSGHEGSDDGMSEEPGSHESVPLTTDGKSSKSPTLRKGRPARSLPYHICQLIIGFLLLSLSGFILSHSVSAIADAFKLSNTLLGMTILSIATTLPEKFIAIVSGARGHDGIVVANTAGSNVFLLTLCSGILFLSGNLEHLRGSVTAFELAVTWVSSLLFFLAVFFGSSRWVGIALFSFYMAFIILDLAMNRR
ncbi:hypothetical protein FGG08_003089 [Glutinoglossum americanum]|uniref:Uncharacterized protein n=1 Tax=Glutinoglossum americanum TaxID=1670608 RepID=A0A9P8KYH5_9PEZI|nr:hypothetical protein FGG08_003089 [Glutinoglossum americanum]